MDVENFLILGLGSIGLRHLKNLNHLRPQANLIAFDPDDRMCTKARREVPKVVLIEKPENVFWDELGDKINNFSAFFICTPSANHALELKRLLGMAAQNVFVEKPLCMHRSELQEIADLVHLTKAKVMTGCNFRYSSGIRFIKEWLSADSNELGKICSVQSEFGQYLPDQRPGRDFRRVYSASKKMGGGVLFDRVHEFDYLHYLFGHITDVAGYLTKNSSLEINTEDTAEVICRFENGILGHIHLDYLSPQYVCRMKIVGSSGMLEWNFERATVEFQKIGEERKLLFCDKHHEANAMYVSEIQDFLNFISSSERAYDEMFESAYQVIEKVIQVKELNSIAGVSH